MHEMVLHRYIFIRFPMLLYYKYYKMLHASVFYSTIGNDTCSYNVIKYPISVGYCFVILLKGIPGRIFLLLKVRDCAYIPRDGWSNVPMCCFSCISCIHTNLPSKTDEIHEFSIWFDFPILSQSYIHFSFTGRFYIR